MVFFCLLVSANFCHKVIKLRFDLELQMNAPSTGQMQMLIFMVAHIASVTKLEYLVQPLICLSV